MARTNLKTQTEFTHEGGPAVQGLSLEQQLRRSVMSTMLWEDTFYEDGVSIADRIMGLAINTEPETVARIAIEARSSGNLRHVPLWLCVGLTQTTAGGSIAEDTIFNCVQRPDEMGEFLSLYMGDKRHPISAQAKRGLARAFGKFDEYQLSKWDRDSAAWRIRDVMFAVHPKPADKERADLYKRIAAREMRSPDTWETGLSTAGQETSDQSNEAKVEAKKDVFERLIREGKLGYMALLRNLRNMVDAGCDYELVKEAIIARKGGAHRVLPFRFLSALDAAPAYADPLGAAMLASIKELPPLTGRTIVAVDTSGSMETPLSQKSRVKRVDAAAMLASMVNGQVRLLSFASGVEELPFYQGLAGAERLRSAIGNVGHGTDIGLAVEEANKLPHDRLIVITDEQSRTRVPDPKAEHAYLINVASYENGIGYGKWTHINGFSEQVIRFIHELEATA